MRMKMQSKPVSWQIYNSSLPIVAVCSVLVTVILTSLIYVQSTKATEPNVPQEVVQQEQSNDIKTPSPSPTPLPEQVQQPESEKSNKGKCEVSNKYPEKITQWCELITKQANKRGLDPDLVAALIWQESGGNPQAYSKSGAVGLMQVMPRDGLAATFMCVNGPCFANRPSMEELYKPTFNVKFGTEFLGNLVSKYGLRDGLKRYGPMNVGYYYADKVIGIYNNYKR